MGMLDAAPGRQEERMGNWVAPDPVQLRLHIAVPFPCLKKFGPGWGEVGAGMRITDIFFFNEIRKYTAEHRQTVLGWLVFCFDLPLLSSLLRSAVSPGIYWA